MKYAIKYYMTPEEIAEQVKTICRPFGPRNGYRMDEYDGRRRLEDIANMVHALREEIRQHEKLQLADGEQFEQVQKILEWDNFHTENVAFGLAFGDEYAVLDALRTVHTMGQGYAICSKLQHVEFI